MSYQDGSGIRLAKRAYSHAKTALERIVKLENENDVCLDWADYVDQWRRCAEVLESNMRIGPLKKFGDEMKHQRKKDKVLQYIYQSRNASTYRSEDVSRKTPDFYKVGVPGALHAPTFDIANGQQNVSIRNNLFVEVVDGKVVSSRPYADLEIVNGNVVKPVLGADAAGVRRTPGYLWLLSVKNHDQLYDPPQLTGEKEQNAIAIAQYGLDWLDERIIEAEQRGGF